MIDNAPRSQIGSLRRAEPVPSCGLPESTTLKPQDGNAAIARVQNAVNASLADVPARHAGRERRRGGRVRDVDRGPSDTLSGNFFMDVRFTPARITLPGEVQEAVNKPLAAMVAVSEAQAEVAQAEAEAKANKARQDGYDTCPSCAEIEKPKALPQGITVYAPATRSRSSDRPAACAPGHDRAHVNGVVTVSPSIHRTTVSECA